MDPAITKILLVDDDEDEFIMTRDFLRENRQRDYRLDWESAYAPALEKILAGEYDVCLIDYRLGAHNGLELISEARRQGGHAPMILLTGGGNYDIDIAAMKAGAADYLVKDELTPALLDRSIRYAVSAARTTEQLRVSEERYALAVRAASDGLWDWNLLTRQIYYAPRWKEMLGCDDADIGDSPDEWLSRVHPEDIRRVREEMQNHLAGQTPQFQSEYRMIHGSGTWLWVSARGLAISDASGRQYRMAGSQTDITARKHAEERLKHDARHDPLTDLPNRVVFIERLEQAIARHRQEKDYLFAVLFLDIDRFKMVNDSSGHRIGDQLLVAVARRISAMLRPGDMIARHGGDEFTILLEHLKKPADLGVVVDRILRHVNGPFEINGQEMIISASAGIAMNSVSCEDPEQMLRDADIAMFRAKTRGPGSYEVFSSGMHQEVVSAMRMENDLRNALRDNEFVLHYQPIFRLVDLMVVGFEALIRWNHPQRGMVAPGLFIPVAEENGLIHQIGRWALGETCRQMREWTDLLGCLPDFSLSVNLSPRQFSQPDLAEWVRDLFEQVGLRPQALRLELTESAVMENAAEAERMLSQLRETGASLAIDEFGTGYSSLSYLHRFPIDILKIDRSFINRMDEMARNIEFVRAIVTLAHSLGMSVVAEGVETVTQLDALRELGCEYGQGFYMARPMDKDAAFALLRQSRGIDLPQSHAQAMAGAE
ncbi:MAG: EAL domain-containing protein [Blastocatellia bacterium]